jgi:hypothetical protein
MTSDVGQRVLGLIAKATMGHSTDPQPSTPPTQVTPIACQAPRASVAGAELPHPHRQPFVWQMELHYTMAFVSDQVNEKGLRFPPRRHLVRIDEDTTRPRPGARTANSGATFRCHLSELFPLIDADLTDESLSQWYSCDWGHRNNQRRRLKIHLDKSLAI